VAEHQERKQNPKGRERSMEAVAAFCREMIELLGVNLLLEGSEDNGIVLINFSGPDRPLLLSNGASLLNGMEYLLNRIFRADKEETPGIALDSENYRKHREAELVLLAQMASKKVISFHKPLNLQPMVPRERRIVHLALAGIEGVRTQSEGEGDSRSITIYPS
jgi:spoIIIJ-associated protein